MEPFKKFTIEERVRWGDVDAAGIIFYGSFIRFFEYSETELFSPDGLPVGIMFDQLNIWLPRVHLENDFYHAAKLDDLLQVSVFVAKIGHSSLRLEVEDRRNNKSELIAKAHLVLVTVTRSTFESIPVPEELRRRLAPYTSTD